MPNVLRDDALAHAAPAVVPAPAVAPCDPSFHLFDLPGLMHIHTSRAVFRPLTAAALSLALAATAAAQTTPATIDACFVPASGTLYRIDTQASPAPGAPKACLSPLHTRQTWNQQGAPCARGASSRVRAMPNVLRDDALAHAAPAVVPLLRRAA